MIPLTTERLTLVPATAKTLHLEIEDPVQFFKLLNVQPIADWPSANLAHALPFFRDQLREDASLVGWLAWYWLLGTPAGTQLVGGSGFKGEPVEGIVEMGYETRSVFRRQGFATEAVGRLTQWALGHPTVAAVVAEADADNAASIGVLRTLGFHEIGPGSEPGLRRYRLDK